MREALLAWVNRVIWEVANLATARSPGWSEDELRDSVKSSDVVNRWLVAERHGSILDLNENAANV